jgi:hypothetical protein
LRFRADGEEEQTDREEVQNRQKPHLTHPINEIGPQ